MILFDVNILIYAHREDQAHHAFYRNRLESTLAEGGAFGLTPLVAGGFIRIVTQPNFPNGPTPIAQALAVIDGLMSQPKAHWVTPGNRHWELLSELCRKSGCQGKAVADAHHAAIAIENACTWISRDPDFERFTPCGLRFDPWQPPGA